MSCGSCLFDLIPDQPPEQLGLELLIQSSLWTLFIARFAIRSIPETQPSNRLGPRVILPAIGTIPYLIGSVVLLTGSDSGMYWIFAGVIGAIVAAVVDARVLLVEIRR